MKLALRIFDSYRSYTFAVVDLDLSSEYPQNYIAILPRIWYKFTNKNGSPNSKLIEIFGLEEAQKIGKSLLEKALVEFQHNDKIKAEIEQRLLALNPKPKLCVDCGLKRERGRFKYCKSCADRRQKEYQKRRKAFLEQLEEEQSEHD